MQQPSISPSQGSISAKVILLVSLLFPPAGLVMLWMKRNANVKKKLLSSAGIIALGAAYVFLLTQTRVFTIVFKAPAPLTEAHYSELDRHRAQQKAEAASAPAVPEQPAAAAPAQATTPTPNAAPIAANPSAARYVWANFRGANRDGRYDEKRINTSWPSEGLKPAWKQPVGGGWASFVVADGVAFTIEQRREREVVAAYDIKTGGELWTQGWNAQFRTYYGGEGPRATPTWDNGKIYALGATGELRCLDARTGKVAWGKNILSDNDASNLEHGMAASPLVVDDKVIVHPGGKAGKSFVAYHKNTGAPLWRSLDDDPSYVSPMLVTLAGKRQILAVTSSRVVGLNPDDGALLWSYPWALSSGSHCAQPILVDGNRFFISSGYGKGAALVEVKDTGGSLVASGVWENIRMKNLFSSSVLHKGLVYGLDEGILACLDVSTGERKWKGGRYGSGQVILASDHLIILTEEGELALVRATPESFQEVVKFQVLEGKTWNNPALADGLLLIRNGTEMACFNLAQ